MDLNQCARPVTAYKRNFDTFGAVPDVVAEEVPVALVYNGISQVVMMALPSDLEEFAVGVSLRDLWDGRGAGLPRRSGGARGVERKLHEAEGTPPVTRRPHGLRCLRS